MLVLPELRRACARERWGAPFPHVLFEETRSELVQRFGGLTAHVRAPARGLWKADDGSVARDDVAIFEVMAEGLDRAWWAEYRRTLERRFRQEVMIVRATRLDIL